VAQGFASAPSDLWRLFAESQGDLLMMLVEMTTTPDAALPVAELKQQLRLGTGFGEDSLQDPILVYLLKAAIAAIEGRTGKALLSRRFSWSLTGWRDAGAQRLPMAPVSAIYALKLITLAGVETVVDPDAYRLVRDLHVPELVSASLALPSVPTSGTAEIELEAGYDTVWSGVPADLGHAVLLLAAHYYEHRHEGVEDGVRLVPFGVSALIERYRGPRLGRWSQA
jgi:uncharacterized phiE125 gp8 family phage protein